MRKLLGLLVCLTLLTGLLGTAFAEDAPLRTIQDGERMLLDGKDIFTYNSGEIYTMRAAQGNVRDDTIGYTGYGNDDAPADTIPGIVIGFGDYAIFTQSDDPDAVAKIAALIALPLNKTDYAITEVRVDKPSLSGPFGITVSMTTEALLATGLSFTIETYNDDIVDTGYIARYQDPAHDGNFTIFAQSSKGIVTNFSVSRGER